MRFLHFSDLHFGSRLTSGRLRLPADARARREREFRECIDRLVGLARDREVDAVLAPGDLFDDESAEFDSIAFLIDRFNRFAPTPVFVAAGNHDPLGPASPWNRAFLSTRHPVVWGDHVHIFPADRWESIDSVPGVEIVGRSWGPGSAGRRLTDPPPPDPGDLPQVVVAHGSDEARMPPGKVTAHPFTADDLACPGRVYAAIGHFHHPSEIRAGDGRLVGAYAGAPVARGLDETEAGSALIVETGGAESPVELERVRIDPRRVVQIDLDLTGVGHADAARERVETAVRSASPDGTDLCYVRAHGVLPPGLELATDAIVRDLPAFHVELDLSEVRPDYDLEAILAEDPANVTVEARFVRALRERREATEDPGERAVIDAALACGLDALRTGKVRMRRVD